MSQYRFDWLSVDDDAEISPMAPGIMAAMAQKAAATVAKKQAPVKTPVVVAEPAQKPAKPASAAPRRENQRPASDRREPRQPRGDAEQRAPRQPRPDGEERRPRQPRGEGEQQRAPRQARERRDFTPREVDGVPAEERPVRHEAKRTHQQRRVPNHGREFDRHSGSNRYDGKKKEVAGASWGAPVDVPVATSVENAITANDEVDQSVAASLVNDSEAVSSDPAAAEEPKEPQEATITLDEYLKSRKTKSSLKAKVSCIRRDTENFISLSKNQVSDERLKFLHDPMLGLMAAPVEAETVSQGKSKKKKSQRKHVEVIQTSFQADHGARTSAPREHREPRDGNNAGGFRERRGENRGERRNNAPRNPPRGETVAA